MFFPPSFSLFQITAQFWLTVVQGTEPDFRVSSFRVSAEPLHCLPLANISKLFSISIFLPSLWLPWECFKALHEKVKPINNPLFDLFLFVFVFRDRQAEKEGKKRTSNKTFFSVVAAELAVQCTVPVSYFLGPPALILWFIGPRSSSVEKTSGSETCVRRLFWFSPLTIIR